MNSTSSSFFSFLSFLHINKVTNCFALPSVTRSTEEEGEEETNSTDYYQMEMMRALREVNVDYYTVGWYTSTQFGSISDSLIMEHFNYQSTIKKCVVVLFDPLKLSKGELSL